MVVESRRGGHPQWGLLWTLRNPILTTGWAKKLWPLVIGFVRQRGEGLPEQVTTQKTALVVK